MKRISILIAMLLPVLLACSRSGEYEELPMYEKANPEIDLQRALSHSDFRFVAMMGYGVDVPGIKNFHEKYAKYGYKVIKGTSDVIRDYEHGRLMAIARYYAERYNFMLEAQLDEVDSRAMSDSLQGAARIQQEFSIEKTISGNINMLPESMHVALVSKQVRCVKRAWWFDPIQEGRPKYDWNQFFAVFNEIDEVTCKQKWISDWVASGRDRSAEAQVFGVRSYTETNYESFVRTPWEEAGLASEPAYELNLRVGEDCVGTLFLSKDGSNAMITSLRPKGGAHWLDRESLFYHPSSPVPQVITVDQAGNWERKTTRQHNKAL